ncbi:MAG: tRNA-dihydrouridine synthase [Candidatus Magasanikbacteria bacterium]|nr:tRNA-dihydrouridine synthase [Candidatus Magasanikbacteria bacterium]
MSWIKNILEKNKKILALSPMADMTDSAFCQIVRQIGGADIVYREMVSAEALIRENAKTLGMTDFVDSERPIVQQIFGSEPLVMARAASIVMEHANPEGLDINMGCPVYKITSNFNGCALMKDPERAAAIVREMRSAIGDRVPISVKIRLGWSDPDDFKKFIPVVEEAGVSLITIHGRTKAQGYSGKSDWARIGEAKKIARVPLLANGDIHEPYQVAEVLGVTNADGVLIARGALGNPWFFQLANQESRIMNQGVSLEERVGIVLQHARLHCAQYGERGIVSFRKHLSWYFKGSRIMLDIPGIKEVREKLVRVNSLTELEEILKGLLQTNSV